MRDRKDDTTHRTVAAAKLGRPLRASEVADHIDEDKSNNAPANIHVQTRSAHTTQHNKARPTSKLRAALRMVKERKRSY